MARFRGNRTAFGAPGACPVWTHANKDGIGTAPSPASRIWFTIWHGILTEAYYPTVDRPQLKDLEFLFTDGSSLFLEEKRDLVPQTERIEPSQGYKVTQRDPLSRFSFTKEIISAPLQPCILMRTKFEGDHAFLRSLKAYLLCAPHLELGGRGNNAFVIEVSGRELLAAEKSNRWIVCGASCHFSRLSCGYVGHSDGYSDLAKNHTMTFEFDQAKDGNVALTGELDILNNREFTIGIAFGESLSSAVSVLFQSLGVPFNDQRKAFIDQWTAAPKSLNLEEVSGDGGHLFRSSYNLLLTHEDKLFQGAFVASLTIPSGRSAWR